MYHNLAGNTKMGFGPFDLAAEARDVLSESIPRGIPYVILILIVVGTSYYQQRQISARRTEGAPSMNAQQQMLLRFLPLLSGFWSFLFPAGLVLYWATSNTFRIGQQAYITHQIYGRETEAGKHTIVIPERDDEPADKKKHAKSGNKGQSGTSSSAAKKGSSSKKASATANDSDNESSSRADRNAEWKKLRAKKQAAQRKTSTTTSSRVTPKGTQGRPSKPKRKR